MPLALVACVRIAMTLNDIYANSANDIQHKGQADFWVTNGCTCNYYIVYPHGCRQIGMHPFINCKYRWMDDLRFYVPLNSISVISDGRVIMEGCMQWNSIYD